MGDRYLDKPSYVCGNCKNLVTGHKCYFDKNVKGLDDPACAWFQLIGGKYRKKGGKEGRGYGIMKR